MFYSLWWRKFSILPQVQVRHGPALGKWHGCHFKNETNSFQNWIMTGHLFSLGHIEIGIASEERLLLSVFCCVWKFNCFVIYFQEKIKLFFRTYVCNFTTFHLALHQVEPPPLFMLKSLWTATKAFVNYHVRSFSDNHSTSTRDEADSIAIGIAIPKSNMCLNQNEIHLDRFSWLR